MDEAEREQHALYARTTAHTMQLRRARALTAKALGMGVPAYVAFSGGKDSSVVAALAREIDPAIPLVWSDDEWYLPETGEYMARIRESGADLRTIRTNAKHADWLTVKSDYDGIPDYARQQGWGMCILGLRQEESSIRRMALRKHGPIHYAASTGAWHVSPIASWSWRDVWAYLVATGCDYNAAYDRLSAIGVPREHQRVGPLAVERVLGYGQLAVLKRGWPDLYNRFAAAHPEARLYS